MPIEDIVHVTIKRESSTVSRASFATIMLAGYHTRWGATERVRTYSASSALSDMVADGFAVTDPLYLQMQAVVSQNPRVRSVKVGKLLTSWTQTYRIVPVEANSAVYSGSVGGQPWTFTADASATLAEVCTGIAAAINGLTGAGATADGASGTHVDVTSSAPAKIFNVSKGSSAGAYELSDITVATGLAAELASLRAVDDAWYGLALDCDSNPRVLAAAAYVETLQALYVARTCDSLCLDPSSTADIMSQLKALGYARTAALYHPDASSAAGAAWLGCVLPYDAGGATWAYKSIRGVAVTKLSTNAQGAIATKKGNFYVSVAGVAGTRWGVTASGEYIDTTLCVDWLHARWGERLFALLSSVPKLPYTDASVVKVKAEIGAVNGLAVRQGIIADDPAPTVEAQKVLDVDPTDRANRLLPDVRVTARLAGAIHEIDVTASLSV